LTLILSLVYGQNDTDAGTVYGVWGIVTGLVGSALGPVIDMLGVAKCMLLGGATALIGRAIFAGARTVPVAFMGLFLLQPIGLALGIPVLSIAIRRLTCHDSQYQSTAFGAFYSCMNVGAFFAGVLSDAIRASSDSDIDALRTILWTATLATAAYLGIALYLIRHDIGLGTAITTRPSCSDVNETYKNTVFWRLVVFIGLLFGARSIFRHIDGTLPKWMRRTLGPHSAYGLVYAINPAIIIFAVPLAQRWLSVYDPYVVIVLGTCCVALAPLVLAVMIPSYTSVVAFMLLVSAGEAMYSPKSIEYCLALAPPGKEGLYGALASAPLFAVKLLVGMLGGHLLEEYCSATVHQCALVWLIIGATSVITPLGLAIAYNWVYGDSVRAQLEQNKTR